MNKKAVIVFLIIIVLAVAGYCYFNFSKKPAPQPSQTPRAGLTEDEARAIAEKTCIKGGETLMSGGTYNENSKTWWFEANLNSAQQGCNPACVVAEESKTAEINWRCTGLIAPEEPAGETIRQVFAGKYPKYGETLSVRINKETTGHARGSVTFVDGEPGGLFLAAKIDDQWQIVYEGNGAIPCNLSKYGFPNDMLADCAD
jgi:hypothetical protein